MTRRYGRVGGNIAMSRTTSLIEAAADLTGQIQVAFNPDLAAIDQNSADTAGSAKI